MVLCCHDQLIPEPFLASGIPDLELNPLAIKRQGSDFEVNSDRRDVAVRKGVIGEAR